MAHDISTCSECGSAHNRETSEMASLCPACAHVIYGYEACEHEFEHGRCVKCYWDGSESAYVKKLKSE